MASNAQNLIVTGVRLSSTSEPNPPHNRFPAGFAVVDVETTGLRWKAERIIEIAVVRLDTAGTVVSEFVTLVDPERHPGATHIHGLSAEDLQGAPRFAEVARELIRYLEGAVIVGHNVMFDVSFLREEFFRAGLLMPRIPLLDTREMTQTMFPRLGEYRLASCCRAYEITQGPEHRALEDARATATLFARLWAEEAIQRDAPRGDLQHAQSIVWPDARHPSRLFTREEAAKQRKVEASRLEEVLASLPEGSTTNSIDGYLNLLDDILDDRYVSEQEAAIAQGWIAARGLLRDDVQRAHRTYLANVARSLLEADLSQGIGADDLKLVTRLLGLSTDDMTHAMEQARDDDALPWRTPSKPLREGTTICFTGNPIPSKFELEGLAVAAGLMVKESVTKKLEVLVVDEPRSMSNKAQKARTLNTRILAVPVFLVLLKKLTNR